MLLDCKDVSFFFFFFFKKKRNGIFIDNIICRFIET